MGRNICELRIFESYLKDKIDQEYLRPNETSSFYFIKKNCIIFNRIKLKCHASTFCHCLFDASFDAFGQLCKPGLGNLSFALSLVPSFHKERQGAIRSFALFINATRSDSLFRSFKKKKKRTLHSFSYF